MRGSSLSPQSSPWRRSYQRLQAEVGRLGVVGGGGGGRVQNLTGGGGARIRSPGSDRRDDDDALPFGEPIINDPGRHDDEGPASQLTG